MTARDVSQLLETRLPRHPCSWPTRADVRG